MCTAELRVYAELNDFLPREQRGRDFERSFVGRPSVKDLIEAAGVPHTEIDLILVNGSSVDFAHRVQDGDRISVYPVFESIDVAPLSRLRPTPLRCTRFVLDTHLGRLARFLRLVGFDTLYRNDYGDATLARISSGEGRILLTRDRDLLRRSEITHGYWVRETDPDKQLAEVIHRFDLRASIRPFTRCMNCNGGLVAVAKKDVIARLPRKVRERQEEFTQCEDCGRVYWEGTHLRRLRALVARAGGEQRFEDDWQT